MSCDVGIQDTGKNRFRQRYRYRINDVCVYTILLCGAGSFRVSAAKMYNFATDA